MMSTTQLYLMIAEMIIVILLVILKSIVLLKETSYTCLAKSIMILVSISIIPYCFNIAFKMTTGNFRISIFPFPINAAIEGLLISMVILSPNIVFSVIKILYSAMKGSNK